MASSLKADYGVITAETLWTEYVIEHNLPFSSSDDFSSLVKKMFPDSKIAQQFACCHTKTTAIARVLGQETQGEMLLYSLN